jgi:hypothetical protein
VPNPSVAALSRLAGRASFVLAAALAAGCVAISSGVPLPPAGPAVLGQAPPEDPRRYLGSASCRACHPGAYERWRATGHALDYAGLPEVSRGESACLRCHVTGFGEPLGYRGTATPELSAVGCEACHGAGGDHARSAQPAFVPTATGGECPPCEVNRICRLCHTPLRSPEFDLARDLPRVSCRP